MSGDGAASPFSPRAALALVGFGALVFVALLLLWRWHRREALGLVRFAAT